MTPRRAVGAAVVVMLLIMLGLTWLAKDATNQALDAEQAKRAQIEAKYDAQANAAKAKVTADSAKQVLARLCGAGDRVSCDMVRKINSLPDKEPRQVVGPIGPIGPVGPVGPVGPRGPIGPDGDAGISGQDGTTGPAGPAGETGPAGPVGPAGAKGETGPAGPQGEQGLKGEPGEPGPQGEPGTPGPACPDGYTGRELTVLTPDGSPGQPVTQTIWACVPN